VGWGSASGSGASPSAASRALSRREVAPGSTAGPASAHSVRWTRPAARWSASSGITMSAGGNEDHWGARPPSGATEVFVVGKRWMWKVQHQTGQREMNELHVPVGRPVQLTLTSEDVIHDFFVPAFRTKIDVLPGRYVQTWFQATKPGRYHLFCSQYCGTNHSGMVGWVTVQEPAEFADWLNKKAEGSLALQGRKLFLKLQCVTCHSANAKARAPVLEGLYGQIVHLQDGRQVVADEAYLRESILKPRAKIVAGWEPIMPTFEGQLADPSVDLSQEEAMIQLLAFLKSLKPGQTPVRTEDFPPPAVNPKAVGP